jgi:uncharacterized repeat protein (TIGR01451 family)
MTWFLRCLCALLVCFAAFKPALANQVVNPFFTVAGGSWTFFLNGTGATNNRVLEPGAPAVLSSQGNNELYSGCVGAACLTYPLANPSSSGARQTVPLTIGTVYVLSFWTFGSNVASTAAANIRVHWCGNAVPIFDLTPANTSWVGWNPRQIVLPAAISSSCELAVLIRDDPSYSAITNMVLEPAQANLSISKTNAVSSLVAGASTTYTITVSNAGPSAAPGAVVRDTAPAGLNCTTLNCNATPGATCPGSLSVANFLSTGLSVPNFNASSTVTFTLGCGVTATGF